MPSTPSTRSWPGSFPGGEASVWIWSWIWAPAIGLVVFLDLHFPNGRLPGARWRWSARFTFAAVLVGALLTAFSPGPILELPIHSPLGIEVLPSVSRMVEAFMYARRRGACSMLLRLRRVGWIERRRSHGSPTLLRWGSRDHPQEPCLQSLPTPHTGRSGSPLLLQEYDTRKTLQAFSARLRNETNLDALSEDLVRVVKETMQPAHISLWLHPDTTPEGEQSG